MLNILVFAVKLGVNRSKKNNRRDSKQNAKSSYHATKCLFVSRSLYDFPCTATWFFFQHPPLIYAAFLFTCDEETGLGLTVPYARSVACFVTYGRLMDVT